MSYREVEMVRAGLEHFASAGEPVWEHTHEDVEVHDHDIMDGEDYFGHEGVRRWLADWAAAWSDFSMEPEEYIDGDGCVIAVVRMRATGARSGIEVDRRDAILFRFRDDKYARIDYFNSREQAIEEAGL
jgi:ketosteroid isomerase-like protein